MPLAARTDQAWGASAPRLSTCWSLSAAPVSSCPPKTSMRAAPRLSGMRHAPCLCRAHGGAPSACSSDQAVAEVLKTRSWSTASVSDSRLPRFWSEKIDEGAAPCSKLNVACPRDWPPK